MNNDIKKLVTLAVLSAIGVVLMVLIEIPYFLAPWLKIEVSDIVVLIALAIYGFKGGLTVGIIKTLADLLFTGMSGPYAIGQITALSASLSYVMLVHLLKLNIKEDSKLKILIKCGIILISVSSIMTIANYLFITPIYTGEFFWFQVEDYSALGYDGSYIMAIIITYLPFNLIKGSLILTVYYLIAPRVLDIFNKESNNSKEEKTLQ